MPRGRQRRKARRQAEPSRVDGDPVATTMDEMVGSEEENLAEAREQMGRRLYTDFPNSPESPEHPLLPGIRMFSAMLGEARAGYILDSLGRIEEETGFLFNPLEREGIVQVASNSLGPDGVPNVELAITLALEERQSLEEDAEIEQERIDEVREEVARQDLAREAMVEQEEDFEPEENEPEDPDAPGPEEMGA